MLSIHNPLKHHAALTSAPYTSLVLEGRYAWDFSKGSRRIVTDAEAGDVLFDRDLRQE